MTPEALIIESMFQVVTKEGEDIPFVLNGPQRELDEELTGRDLIPKFRQPGVSTYFLARYTAACLSKRNVKAVIISHESESTQRLLNRCQYFLDNIRGPAPVIGRESISVLTFPKMDSMIYIGTAGSKKFGRGDTISHLHCSEYAYWPDAKRLMSGLMQSVPRGGEVAIESTGNGIGNDYHQRCVRAYEGKSRWKCHFLAWNTFPEYCLEVSDREAEHIMTNLVDEWDEPDLVNNHELTAGQIAWRREKLEEFNYDLRVFRQEYPLVFNDCFQAAGESIFQKVRYEPTFLWIDRGNYLWSLEGHPKTGHTYCLGGDPSGGVGRDNAAAQIICLDTMEQVAEFAHNRFEPDVFGQKCVQLARMFNNAYIVIESNNHGPVSLNAIRQSDYPPILVYEQEHASASGGVEDRSLMKMGVRTTSRSKPLMIGSLRTAVTHTLTIHSPLLMGEMSTFIENEEGKLGASSGCFDDRVIGLSCANWGLERAGLYARPEEARPKSKPEDEPFGLDHIINELRGRGGSFPIAKQHMPTT